MTDEPHREGSNKIREPPNTKIEEAMVTEVMTNGGKCPYYRVTKTYPLSSTPPVREDVRCGTDINCWKTRPNPPNVSEQGLKRTIQELSWDEYGLKKMYTEILPEMFEPILGPESRAMGKTQAETLTKNRYERENGKKKQENIKKTRHNNEHPRDNNEGARRKNKDGEAGKKKGEINNKRMVKGID